MTNQLIIYSLSNLRKFFHRRKNKEIKIKRNDSEKNLESTTETIDNNNGKYSILTD